MTKFCFLGLLAAGLTASQSAQFRTSTELVSVDTVVTTPDGQQVTDLTAKDFVLKVDGKPRPIQSVQFVRFNESTGSRPSTPSLPSLPAATLSPFSTNTDPKGRTFIFAIDHNNIHPGNERPAIDAAIRLLDRLTPTDRAAVVTLPRGGVAADLSTDRAETRKALEGIIGHAPRASSQFGFSVEEALTVFGAGKDPSSDLSKSVISEMVSRECGSNITVCPPAVMTEAREYGRSLMFNTRDTLLALSAFMTGLSSLEGTKSIVFISEGLIETPDNRNDFNDLGRVADASRVRMFVIQLNTPVYDINTRKAPANANGDIALELAGLENVAGVTGGEVFRPSGRVDSAMDQIDRATSAYYLVGFEPNEKERDGKYHKIELSLVRKDLRIKARGGFEIGAPANDKTDKNKKNASAPSLTGVLHDNIRDYRDLPLRAAAFAFRNETSTIKVLVLAETLGTGTMTSAAFALISESGGQGAEWAADAADLAASPVVTAGAVQPGRYRVRVAAGDALGRTGAVDAILDARLTDAGPLQVSSLLPGRLVNGNFQPRLDFAGAAEITGLMELYNVPLLAGVPAVRLELAATPDGPVLAHADAAIAATASADRRIARGTVTIPAAGPPGDLFLRAQILLDGKAAGTVVRAIKR